MRHHRLPTEALPRLPQLLLALPFASLALLSLGPVSAQPTSWTLESTPVASSINAVTNDGTDFIAVGDNGVILRRAMQAAAGMGTWTLESSGTTEDLLDVKCREGIGCAASGWDVVLTNLGGGWTSLRSTPGEQRVYGPVWIYDDAVLYGEIPPSIPLSFVWRTDFMGQSLGMAIGPSPAMVFCERMNELLLITRQWEVLGVSPDLASTTSYLAPDPSIDLSGATFLEPTCALSPGGEHSDATRGPSSPLARAVRRFNNELWLYDLLLNDPMVLSPFTAIELLYLVPRLASSHQTLASRSGHQEAFLAIGSSEFSLPATYGILRDGLDVVVTAAQVMPTGGAGTVIGTLVLETSGGPGADARRIEVAVGTGGLVAMRQEILGLFLSGFETGDTSEWSTVQTRSQ